MAIIAVYALNKIMRLDKAHFSVKLINASHTLVLYLQIEEACTVNITVRDTCGHQVASEQKVTWQPGMIAIDVPCSGLVELEIG